MTQNVQYWETAIRTRKLQDGKIVFGNFYSFNRREWAMDPWSLNLRFWGAPIFSPEVPNPCFEGFQSNLGQKSGAPQTQIQRPRIQRPIVGPLIKIM